MSIAKSKMTTLCSKNDFKKFDETVDETQKTMDVVNKFKTYRQSLESNEKKLKEATFLIDQLKTELKIVKDAEKCTRNQLSTAQSRIIQLHDSLNQFIFISDQQRQIEKTSKQLEQKIEHITEVIHKVKEKTENLSNKTSKQLNLIKENKSLASVLKTKEFEYNLLKIDIQSLTNEKNKQKIEYEQKIKKLENELEQSKRDSIDIKSEFDKTILIYKKQIQENEQMIEEFEKERRSLLEDFEQPKNFETKGVKFTCDSTVLINTDERMDTLSADNTKRHEETGDTESDVFLRSLCMDRKSIFKPKPKTPRDNCQAFRKPGEKPKHQLGFLTQCRDSNQPNQQTTPKIKTKRKLFSTNCNHYEI